MNAFYDQLFVAHWRVWKAAVPYRCTLSRLRRTEDTVSEHEHTCSSQEWSHERHCPLVELLKNKPSTSVKSGIEFKAGHGLFDRFLTRTALLNQLGEHFVSSTKPQTWHPPHQWRSSRAFNILQACTPSPNGNTTLATVSPLFCLKHHLFFFFFFNLFVWRKAHTSRVALTPKKPWSNDGNLERWRKTVSTLYDLHKQWMERLNASPQWVTSAADCIMGAFAKAIRGQQSPPRYVCCNAWLCINTNVDI